MLSVQRYFIHVFVNTHSLSTRVVETVSDFFFFFKRANTNELFLLLYRQNQAAVFL